MRRTTWAACDPAEQRPRPSCRLHRGALRDRRPGVDDAGRLRAGSPGVQVFTATFVLRIVDGLVAQTWRNADDLGRLLRLGARIEDGER